MASRALQITEGFAARLDGQSVAFAHRGADRLLAYLALNGPQARVRVAESLWPGVDRERALASLRQAVRSVHLLGGEGWIVADRASLSLAAGVEVETRPQGPLLGGWNDAWLERRRAVVSSAAEPPFEALFGLVDWFRDRAPATAIQVVSEALAVAQAAPPARLAREVGPLLARLNRLPKGSFELCDAVARAHYLVGDMGRAYALYGRIVHELETTDAAMARLSQVVILRESGLVRSAVPLAEEAVARRPRTPYGEWNTRYHLGYSRYLAGDPEGLAMARAAVESGMADAAGITRAFPLLNVAEALIDAGDPAALGLLRMGSTLVSASDDTLGRFTAELLDSLWAAREIPAEAFERLLALERRAWEARLTPFVAGLADRAAVLAHRLGLRDESARLLRRAERVRRRLRLRRTPIERERLLILGA